MTPEHYWKVKALNLERMVLEQNIQTALKEFGTKYAAAFQEAGLDPSKAYQFDDATQTLTPAETPAPAPEAAGPQLAVDNTHKM